MSRGQLSAWRSRGRPGFALLVTAFALMLLPGPLQAAKAEQAASRDTLQVKDLPERWRAWLVEDVYPLISREQRKAFLSLQTDAQRVAFAERLWRLWGEYTGLGAAFRGAYDERLEQARAEYESTTEDRARILLIHGRPDAARRLECDDIFVPLEVWVYSYIEGLGEDVVLLFYQTYGMGEMRLWNPFNGRKVLQALGGGDASRGGGNISMLDRPEFRCANGDTILAAIAGAEYWLREPRVQEAMNHLVPPRREGTAESASDRFLEFSALLDEGSKPLDFQVEGTALSRRGGMVRMAFTVRVPITTLETAKVGDIAIHQLDVVGEISQGPLMLDRFRYIFTVPRDQDEVGLALERFVRPGEYQLRLKVANAHSNHAGVVESVFVASHDVPEESGTSTVALPLALARPTPTAVPDDTQKEVAPLRLLGPSEDLALSGIQRFEAVCDSSIERVAFLVDGTEVLMKNRPPFDVDLNLGPLPRLTNVTAIGFAADGTEVDRQELALNVGKERFYLKLQPVSPADRGARTVRVTADLNVPAPRSLERLEIYWGDRLLATLTEPPYTVAVAVEGSEEFGYLRGLAVLDDGSQAEDLQLLNATGFGELVEVTAIELPAIVTDRSGHPLEGLGTADFVVSEDGVRQTLSHVALHRDLPVRLGLVIDTSGSMEETLPDVQRVVLGFLRDLLRPRDRAFIEAFSDQPEVLAPFTADFPTLENALLHFYPDRATAFYDAVVMGLFQFAGTKGRKAMVVLTDGVDNASSHTFEDALRYAQSSGVTIYTIGIEIPMRQVRARFQLNKLAETTGGRTFLLNRNANLGDVYATIDRELRTQYLLAYTSSSDSTADSFRRVQVDVTTQGAKVRTVAGYFPGAR